MIYLLVLLTGKPAVFLQTELFSPYRFSLNSVIPSLGHLFLLSILAAVFSVVFYRYFPFQEWQPSKYIKDHFLLASLLIAGALLITLFH